MIASRQTVDLYRLRLSRASERLLTQRAALRRLVGEAARSGLSQREIAKYADLDHSTVSRWLSEGRPKIADVHQLTIWDDLEDDD